MQLYQYPPAPSSSLPSGSATAANQVLEIALLQQIADNQYLPIRSYGTIDFSITNVDNTAFTVLKSDVGGTQIKKIQVFMSSGEPLYVAFGAAGLEVIQGYIDPGGLPYMDMEMPANTRVTVKAVNAVTVNSGVILVNFLG